MTFRSFHFYVMIKSKHLIFENLIYTASSCIVKPTTVVQRYWFNSGGQTLVYNVFENGVSCAIVCFKFAIQ